MPFQQVAHLFGCTQTSAFPFTTYLSNRVMLPFSEMQDSHAGRERICSRQLLSSTLLIQDLFRALIK